MNFLAEKVTLLTQKILNSFIFQFVQHTCFLKLYVTRVSFSTENYSANAKPQSPKFHSSHYHVLKSPSLHDT